MRLLEVFADAVIISLNLLAYSWETSDRRRQIWAGRIKSRGRLSAEMINGAEWNRLTSRSTRCVTCRKQPSIFRMGCVHVNGITPQPDL